MTQYSEKSYKMASDNTKYNAAEKAVILENDEWRDEKEWDEVFDQLQKEQKNLSSTPFPFTTNFTTNR